MIPIRKALTLIILSILFVTGSVASLLFYLNMARERRESDPRFRIVAIAQKSADAESLPTAYLAELIGLSVDHFHNLYRFSTAKAEKKLLSSALIKEASVKKVMPGTLLIEYAVRQPAAFIGEFSNTAVDSEGFLIPFNPFFRPKSLPEIYVGLTSFGEAVSPDDPDSGSWGRKLQGPRAAMALELFKLIQKDSGDEALILRRLDVKNAFALSSGRREIVVTMEQQLEREGVFFLTPHLIRLSPDNFRQEWANYKVVAAYLRENAPEASGEKGRVVKTKPVTIDLRIPGYAFIDPSSAS
jgi:hypothetical protein